MRKINKMICLDLDLVASLDKLELNVSNYCNEKLWDYVTEMENKDQHLDPHDYDQEITRLEEKKAQLSEIMKLKSERKNEGITEEHIKFLKSMSLNILLAKDIKQAWKNKFGNELSWMELKALKGKWAS